MQVSKQENQQAHALENLDVDRPVNVPQGYYADHPRNVMTGSVLHPCAVPRKGRREGGHDGWTGIGRE